MSPPRSVSYFGFPEYEVKFCSALKSFVESDSASGGDVEDFSGGLGCWGVACKEILVDYVVDVGEPVAALFAVAEMVGCSQRSISVMKRASTPE